jgi:hypothetical protein
MEAISMTDQWHGNGWPKLGKTVFAVEHILFAFSLMIIVPMPESDAATVVSSSQYVASGVAFLLSRISGMYLKRESNVGMVIKSVTYGLFLFLLRFLD